MTDHEPDKKPWWYNSRPRVAIVLGTLWVVLGSLHLSYGPVWLSVSEIVMGILWAFMGIKSRRWKIGGADLVGRRR